MDALALSLRTATRDDIAGVDALLARSFPKLLKADYPPSVMVTAVPRLARANPDLVGSGRYFVAEADGRGIVGAGGYSLACRAGPFAEVRHVAVDPAFLRLGVGRCLMAAIFSAAKAEGAARMECLATLTAVPFYAALGFREIGPVEIGLAAGIGFRAVQMTRRL